MTTQTPSSLPENRSLRWLGRCSLAISVLFTGAFGLANAGITSYVVWGTTAVLGVVGIAGSMSLISKAEALDRTGSFATVRDKHSALGLLVGLLITFGGLWLYLLAQTNV